MTSAFLLAAGFGSRLRPLTLHRPKPLLPVCGIPLLDHARAHLLSHGITHLLVNAHHLWQQIAAWTETHDAELQVELPDILGTGGGLRAALPRLSDRVVVFNGDILCDVDLTALLAA
ncbi:MAG: NDP-sugar pyrophosphorylase family protein, partial [Myxococcota bacterium]